MTMPTDRPVTVSVVVPTLDRPAELGQALASITSQRGIDPREIEVIVVNDGGAPVDHVVAAARAGGLRARLVEHASRLGLPTARNTGIDLARGEYLAFLDDDDVFLPDHLRSALDGIEAAGVDAVATSCLVVDHRIDPTTPTGELIDAANMWDFDFDPLLLEVCNLIPVHTVVLRTVTNTPARFTPTLPALEDWDFWLRLTHEQRYRFTRVHEPTVVYHRVPNAASMISDIAAGAAAMAEFSALVRRVWASWPTTSARSARFRPYVGTLYWYALAQLATGRALNPHYYQQTVAALVAAWRQPEAEHHLIEQLHRIVTGGDGDDRDAA